MEMKDDIDRLLKAIEHPDQFSDKEIENLLNAPETREAYELLCNTSSALAQTDNPDIDAEWQKFARAYQNPRQIRKPLFATILRRNAAAAIICAAASLAVVATTVALKHSFAAQEEKIPDVQTTQPPIAAIHSKEATNDTIITSRPVAGVPQTIIFKDEPLDRVLSSIVGHYDATVSFKSPSKKRLRLYFQWDKSLPLSDIVEQLNSFEQIDIKLDNNSLTVE